MASGALADDVTMTVDGCAGRGGSAPAVIGPATQGLRRCIDARTVSIREAR